MARIDKLEYLIIPEQVYFVYGIGFALCISLEQSSRFSLHFATQEMPIAL